MVNIIYTHSHDPLHCLQLQGVFVAVQHLLQVVVSEGRKHRTFFSQLSHFLHQATVEEPDYRGLKQEIQTCFTNSIQCSKLIKVCECDPELIFAEAGNLACKIWKPQLIKAE